MCAKLNKQKGQIIFLDLLFAIVLIILMFFLLSKWSSVKIYNSNSNKEVYELNKIGSIAFNKLTNNPSINCYASDTMNNYIIPSSIFSDSVIDKQKLGLPSNYKCNFSVDNFSLNNNYCTDDFVGDNPKHYFSIDYNVIINNTQLIKKETYNNSIIGNIPLEYRLARLVIWK